MSDNLRGITYLARHRVDEYSERCMDSTIWTSVLSRLLELCLLMHQNSRFALYTSSIQTTFLHHFQVTRSS